MSQHTYSVNLGESVPQRLCAMILHKKPTCYTASRYGQLHVITWLYAWNTSSAIWWVLESKWEVCGQS